MLRFTPVPGPAAKTQIDLFTRWFRTSTGGPLVPQLLTLLLGISRHVGPSTQEFEEAALAAAQEIGPLLTVLPGQSAVQGLTIEEPVAKWVTAANALYDLILTLGQLHKASQDSSLEARQARGVERAQAIFGEELERFSPERRQREIKPYIPPADISERDEVAMQVGLMVDQVWLLPMPDARPGLAQLGIPRLRLTEPGMHVHLNVPFAIQALLIMALHDRSLGRTLVPRHCARGSCRKVALMSPRQRFCSDPCKNAEMVQRSRDKKAQSVKRSPERKRTTKKESAPRRRPTS